MEPVFTWATLHLDSNVIEERTSAKERSPESMTAEEMRGNGLLMEKETVCSRGRTRKQGLGRIEANLSEF